MKVMASTNKKPVSELEGAELDYWVAIAQGWHMGKALEGACDAWRDEDNELRGTVPVSAYMPSTNWSQGGTIIEHEKIAISYHPNLSSPSWLPWASYLGSHTMRDRSPLVAAMRCFVASKFGSYVDGEVN